MSFDRIKAGIIKLFKSGFAHVFGSTVINKIIGFMSTVVLVRILTKSEYGIFTYSWNIYSIAVLFSGFGMASAILQLCSEKNSDVDYCNAVYFRGKRFGSRFNLLFILVFLGIAFFAPLKIPGAKRLLICLCLLPEVAFQYDIQTTYIRSRKKTKEYSYLSILNAVLVLAGSVAGALIGRELGLVFGRYLAYAVTHLVALHLHIIPHHDTGIVAIPDTEKKAMISIGGISMVTAGLSQLLYLIDVFVIGIVIPDETIIASYKVATQIPTALSFIPTAVVTFIYPYFAEKKDNKKWCLTNYKKVLLGIGVFNLLITSILYFGSVPIIRIVFGEKYLDAVTPFRILAVTFFFSGTFRTIAGNLLLAQRKLKYNTFVAGVSGGLNIILDYVMVSNFGMNGAAIATFLVVVFTSIMNVGYLLYVYTRKTQ